MSCSLMWSGYISHRLCSDHRPECGAGVECRPSLLFIDLCNIFEFQDKPVHLVEWAGYYLELKDSITGLFFASIIFINFSQKDYIPHESCIRFYSDHSACW